MTEQRQDHASADATRERAQLGQEILGAQVATGEPGQKQPEHDDPRLSASKTVDTLNDMAKSFEADVYESSITRASKPGNLNPTAPEDRTPQRGPQVLAGAATAAGAIGAARDALTTQLVADARLVSDPRYERDQKVFALGQQGRLGLVPPTEAEVITAASRAGTPPEAAEKLPTTPEEQVSQDMPRLEAAEKRAASVNQTLVAPGTQDLAEKNNGKDAQESGRTGQDAVNRAKASESEQSLKQPTSGNTIK
jgi:hypothetical protein